MATDNFWGKFARWRRHRPFWGGLMLMLSALEMFFSGNMSVGGIEVHLGPQGFLSYLLPLMLLVCGLLAWFTPAQRVFYGIIGLLAALYSFVGLNLGGWFVGMLLGIAGGGLVIAWGPPRNRPPAEIEDAPPGGEPNDVDPERPLDPETTQILEVAGHDDRPHEQPIRPAFVPGFEPDAQPPRQGSAMQRLGKGQKALVIAVVPLAITATILVVGSTLPASADECPAGLSSTTATTSATRAAAAKATTAAAAKATTPASKKTSASATASASASATSDSSSTDAGTTIIDGIEQFIDGVGNLLGVSDAETSSPSASPSSSETASESPSATPSASGSTSATPASSASASASSSAEATSTATASDDSIPCLGARQYGLTASADDVPLVAEKPGVMKVSTLTMEHMLYKGVTDLPTKGGGTIKVLQFNMTKATNTPFTLTVAEPDGGTTTITSDKLITEGDVRFYTPEFKGNLLGLFPVTFTPSSPPPDIPDLGIPLLFTNVTIQLAYVRCNTLTGDPLKLAGS